MCGSRLLSRCSCVGRSSYTRRTSFLVEKQHCKTTNFLDSTHPDSVSTAVYHGLRTVRMVAVQSSELLGPALVKTFSSRLLCILTRVRTLHSCITFLPPRHSKVDVCLTVFAPKPHGAPPRPTHPTFLQPSSSGPNAPKHAAASTPLPHHTTTPTFTVILVGFAFGRLNIVDTETASSAIGRFAGTLALPALLMQGMGTLDTSTIAWHVVGGVLVRRRGEDE